MVFMLYGNSGIGALVRSGIRILICSRHLLRSRAISNLDYFLQNVPFSLIRAQRDLSSHSNLITMFNA